jgi:hypothetical protein
MSDAARDSGFGKIGTELRIRLPERGGFAIEDGGALKRFPWSPIVRKQTALSIEEVTRSACERAHTAIIADLLRPSLFLDGYEPPKLSWRQRIAVTLQEYQRRINDAWLVLTGRAYIGDGW